MMIHFLASASSVRANDDVLDWLAIGFGGLWLLGLMLFKGFRNFNRTGFPYGMKLTVPVVAAILAIGIISLALHLQS